MMTEHEDSGRCPVCNGRLLANQTATIPFVLGEAVVVVKDVPAEVCSSCGEPYLTGAATDRLLGLLRRFTELPMEVTVTSYTELEETVPV
jgi:YgiT-type zinc finger domain-containing protein